MDAKDLMIGDWVLYNPNVFIEDEYELPKDCYPIKISCGEDIDLAIEDCYSPIPITAEILEKNGWSYNNEDAKYAAETWVGNGLMLHENGVGYRIVVVSDYDDEDTNYTPFVITDIHQLQHALRLAGIEKEIEL